MIPDFQIYIFIIYALDHWDCKSHVAQTSAFETVVEDFFFSFSLSWDRLPMSDLRTWKITTFYPGPMSFDGNFVQIT